MMEQKVVSLIFESQYASDTDSVTIFNLARNGLAELCEEFPIFSHFQMTIFREIPPFNHHSSTYRRELKYFLYLIAPIILRKEVHKCLEFLLRCYRIHTLPFCIKPLMIAILPYSHTALFPRLVSLLDHNQIPEFRFFRRAQESHSGVARSVIAQAAANDFELLSFVLHYTYKLCTIPILQSKLAKIGITGTPTTYTSVLGCNNMSSFSTLLIIDYLSIAGRSLSNHALKELLSFVSRCLTPHVHQHQNTNLPVLQANEIQQQTAESSYQTSSSSSSSTHVIDVNDNNLTIGAYMVLAHVASLQLLDYSVLTTILSLIVTSVPPTASVQTIMYPLMCFISVMRSQRKVLLSRSISSSLTNLTYQDESNNNNNNNQVQQSQSQHQGLIIMLSLDIVKSLASMTRLQEALTVLATSAQQYDLKPFTTSLLVGLAKHVIVPVSILNPTAKSRVPKDATFVLNVQFFDLLIRLSRGPSANGIDHTAISHALFDSSACFDPACLTPFIATLLMSFSKVVVPTTTTTGLQPSVTSSTPSTQINDFQILPSFVAPLKALFRHLIFYHSDRVAASITELFGVLQQHPQSPSSPTNTETITTSNNAKSPNGGYFLNFVFRQKPGVLLHVLSKALAHTPHQIFVASSSQSASTLLMALNKDQNVATKLAALSQLDQALCDLHAELTKFEVSKQQQSSEQSDDVFSDDDGDDNDKQTAMADDDDELDFLSGGLVQDETSKQQQSAKKSSSKSSTALVAAADDEMVPSIGSSRHRVTQAFVEEASSPKFLRRIMSEIIILLLHLLASEEDPVVLCAIFQMKGWTAALAVPSSASMKLELLHLFSYIATLILEKLLSVFHATLFIDEMAPFQASVEISRYIKDHTSQLTAALQSHDSSQKLLIPPRASDLDNDDASRLDVHRHLHDFMHNNTDTEFQSAIISTTSFLCILHHQFTVNYPTEVQPQTAKLLPYFFVMLYSVLPPSFVSLRDNIHESLNTQWMREFTSETCIFLHSADIFRVVLSGLQYIGGRRDALLSYYPHLYDYTYNEQNNFSLTQNLPNNFIQDVVQQVDVQHRLFRSTLQTIMRYQPHVAAVPAKPEAPVKPSKTSKKAAAAAAAAAATAEPSLQIPEHVLTDISSQLAAYTTLINETNTLVTNLLAQSVLECANPQQQYITVSYLSFWVVSPFCHASDLSDISFATSLKQPPAPMLTNATSFMLQVLRKCFPGKSLALPTPELVVEQPVAPVTKGKKGKKAAAAPAPVVVAPVAAPIYPLSAPLQHLILDNVVHFARLVANDFFSLTTYASKASLCSELSQFFATALEFFPHLLVDSADDGDESSAPENTLALWSNAVTDTIISFLVSPSPFLPCQTKTYQSIHTITSNFSWHHALLISRIFLLVSSSHLPQFLPLLDSIFSHVPSATQQTFATECITQHSYAQPVSMIPFALLFPFITFPHAQLTEQHVSNNIWDIQTYGKIDPEESVTQLERLQSKVIDWMSVALVLLRRQIKSVFASLAAPTSAAATTAKPSKKKSAAASSESIPTAELEAFIQKNDLDLIVFTLLALVTAESTPSRALGDISKLLTYIGGLLHKRCGNVDKLQSDSILAQVVAITQFASNIDCTSLDAPNAPQRILYHCNLVDSASTPSQLSAIDAILARFDVYCPQFSPSSANDEQHVIAIPSFIHLFTIVLSHVIAPLCSRTRKCLRQLHKTIAKTDVVSKEDKKTVLRLETLLDKLEQYFSSTRHALVTLAPCPERLMDDTINQDALRLDQVIEPIQQNYPISKKLGHPLRVLSVTSVAQFQSYDISRQLFISTISSYLSCAIATDGLFISRRNNTHDNAKKNNMTEDTFENIIVLLTTPLLFYQQSSHFGTDTIQKQLLFCGQQLITSLLGSKSPFSTSSYSHVQQRLFDALLGLLSSSHIHSKHSVGAAYGLIIDQVLNGKRIPQFENRVVTKWDVLAWKPIMTSSISSQLVLRTLSHQLFASHFNSTEAITAVAHTVNDSDAQSVIVNATQENNIPQLIPHVVATMKQEEFTNILQTHDNLLPCANLLLTCLQHQYRVNTSPRTISLSSSSSTPSTPATTISDKQLSQLQRVESVETPWELLPNIMQLLRFVSTIISQTVEHYNARAACEGDYIKKCLNSTTAELTNSGIIHSSSNESAGPRVDEILDEISQNNTDYYNYLQEQAIIQTQQKYMNSVLEHLNRYYNLQYVLIELILHIVTCTLFRFQQGHAGFPHLATMLTANDVQFFFTLVRSNTTVPQMEAIVTNIASPHAQRISLPALFSDAEITALRRLHSLPYRSMINDIAYKLLSFVADSIFTTILPEMSPSSVTTLHKSSNEHIEASRSLVEVFLQQYIPTLHTLCSAVGYDEEHCRVSKLNSCLIDYNRKKSSSSNTILNHFVDTYALLDAADRKNQQQQDDFAVPRPVATVENVLSSSLDVLLRAIRSIIAPVIMLQSEDKHIHHAHSFSSIIQIFARYHSFLSTDTLLILLADTLQDCSYYYQVIFDCGEGTETLLNQIKHPGVPKQITTATSDNKKEEKMLSIDEISTLVLNLEQEQQLQQQQRRLKQNNNTTTTLSSSVLLTKSIYSIETISSQRRFFGTPVSSFVSSLIFIYSTFAATELISTRLYRNSIDLLSQEDEFVLPSIAAQQEQFTAIVPDHQSHVLSILPFTLFMTLDSSIQLAVISSLAQYIFALPNFVHSLFSHTAAAVTDNNSSIISVSQAQRQQTFLKELPLHPNVNSAFVYDTHTYSNTKQPLTTEYFLSLNVLYQLQTSIIPTTLENNTAAVNYATLLLQNTVLSRVFSCIQDKRFTAPIIMECRARLSSRMNTNNSFNSRTVAIWYDKQQELNHNVIFLDAFETVFFALLTMPTFLQNQATLFTQQQQTAYTHGYNASYANPIVNHYGIIQLTYQAIATDLIKILPTQDFVYLFCRIFSQLPSPCSSRQPANEPTQFTPGHLFHVYNCTGIVTKPPQQQQVVEQTSNTKLQIPSDVLYESQQQLHVLPSTLLFHRLLSMLLARISYERELLYAESFQFLVTDPQSGSTTNQLDKDSTFNNHTLSSGMVSYDYNSQLSREAASANQSQYDIHEEDDLAVTIDVADAQNSLHQIRAKYHLARNRSMISIWLNLLEARLSALVTLIPWLTMHMMFPILPIDQRHTVYNALGDDQRAYLNEPLHAKIQNEPTPDSFEHIQITLIGIDELIGLCNSLSLPRLNPLDAIRAMVAFNNNVIRKSTHANMNNAAISTILLGSLHVILPVILHASTRVFLTNDLIALAQQTTVDSVTQLQQQITDESISSTSRKKRSKTNTTQVTSTENNQEVQLSNPAHLRKAYKLHTQWFAILSSGLMCISTIISRCNLSSIQYVNPVTSFTIALLLKCIHLHGVQRKTGSITLSTTDHSSSAIVPTATQSETSLLDTAAATSTFKLTSEQLDILQLSSLSLLHTLLFTFTTFLSDYATVILFLLVHPFTTTFNITENNLRSAALTTAPNVSTASADTGKLFAHSLLSIANNKSKKNVTLGTSSSSASTSAATGAGTGTTSTTSSSTANASTTFLTISTADILSQCLFTFAYVVKPTALLNVIIDAFPIVVALGPVGLHRLVQITSSVVDKVGSLESKLRYEQHVQRRMGKVQLRDQKESWYDQQVRRQQHHPLFEDKAASHQTVEHMVQSLDSVSGAQGASPHSTKYSEYDQLLDTSDASQQMQVLYQTIIQVFSKLFDLRSVRGGQVGSIANIEVDDDEQQADTSDTTNETFDAQHKQVQSHIVQLSETKDNNVGKFAILRRVNEWAVSLSHVLAYTTSFSNTTIDPESSTVAASLSADYIQCQQSLQWTALELNTLEQAMMESVSKFVLFLDEHQLRHFTSHLINWAGLTLPPDDHHASHLVMNKLTYEIFAHSTMGEKFIALCSPDVQQELEANAAAPEGREMLSIYYLQMQMVHNLPRVVVLSKVYHALLNVLRHMFLPVVVHSFSGLLLAAFSPLHPTIHRQFMLRKASDTKKAFVKQRITLQSATVAAKASIAPQTALTQKGTKRKAPVAEHPKPVAAPATETTTFTITLASQRLLATTWYLTTLDYMLDLTRIAFTIDLTFVSNQKHNHRDKRQYGRDGDMDDTVHVKSLFRANISQRFFEALFPYVVGQLQQGYKLRQYLPVEYFTKTQSTPLTIRRSQFCILSPPFCLESNYALHALDTSRIDVITPNNALLTNNMLQYGQYIEKAVIPTIIVCAEYAHAVSPIVWEELTNLLVGAAHSKHLQIRFASVTTFLSLLQPQACIRANVHKYKNVTDQYRRIQSKGKEQQPIWSNEYFYACLNKYIPSISTLMQDESLHIQRLTQNLISLIEHIGREPFAKYLS